jgi:hypothetical protein
MELTLNLLWLMLAVPVILLCWQASQSAPGSGKYRQLHFCVLAICLLALAFPVVSASDDLNAMRVELEESSSAQSSIKSAALDSSNCHHYPSSVAAVLCPSSPELQYEVCGEVSKNAQSLPKHVFLSPLGDRAPPLS